MTTIHKYAFHLDELDEEHNFIVRMPQGAKVFRVATQRGTPHLWAAVDPYAKTEQRSFKIIGTGWEVKGKNVETLMDGYIGTFETEGIYVWHLFNNGVWVEGVK